MLRILHSSPAAPFAKYARSATRTVAFYSSSATQQPPSSQTNDSQPHDDGTVEQNAQDAAAKQSSTKTQAQLDEELRQKMTGLSGDGGNAGVEYEDGQPVAMKRGVRENMFRYI